MNYVAGSDRAEALLLPEVLDDYIAPENPVRSIDAFVGQLDLGKVGFTNALLNQRSWSRATRQEEQEVIHESMMVP